MSNVNLKLRQAVARGLNRWLDHVKGVVLDLTPLCGGDLRRSIYTEEATASKLDVKIVSSGGIAPYNIWVHEIEVPKEWTTPGTGPKFITGPVHRNKSKIRTFVKRELER